MKAWPRRFISRTGLIDPIQARFRNLRIPFEGRTERLIAIGRVVLAFFSLLAIWLDPASPAKYETLAYFLLSTYLVYALGIALFVFTSSAPVVRLPLVSHIVDLAMFAVLLYLTEGVASPFFTYFVFALVCATMRWQWVGALWTAVVIMVVFLSIGLFGDRMLQDPLFELNRFVIRSIYLAVVAVLLGYLGAHESHRRKQLGQLAAWSRELPLKADRLTQLVLERASSIFGAPRVLMIWEELEEPWVHVILYANSPHIDRRREPPGRFNALVDASLVEKSFLSHDVQGLTAVTADAESGKLGHWRGTPVDPELQKLFDIRSVVSARIVGENLKGRIFFLDKTSLTSEDLTLAEVVAGQVAATMDLCYFVERLREAAAVEERVRLSRDLHDGVLQSFTAVGLQLQSALKSLKNNPDTLEEQLRNIQGVIFEEHSDLRALVEELRLAQFGPGESDPNLGDLLERLCKMVEQQWSLRVELVMDQPPSTFPASLTREIYRIVREGLVNAARHAKATAARVKVQYGDRQIRIQVSDNGQGFPFYGHYDQASLTEMAVGPASLKSRIASLGGALDIFSSDSGAQLEITLPLPSPGA